MLRRVRLALMCIALGIAVSQACVSAAKTVNRTMPLASDGHVVVETHKGSVQVTTWDRSEVQIDARIEPDDGWTSDADLNRAEVRIDNSSSSVRIKSDPGESPWGWFNWNGSLPVFRYEIRMPRKARLEIKDHRSRIDVDGLEAELRITTHRSEVNITRQNGPVHYHSHRGEIRAQFTHVGNGSIFDTYRGDVELKVPAAQGFRLDADVGRHGDLNSDFDLPSKWDRRGHSGVRIDANVNGGGPGIQLKSYRGRFRLRKT